MSEHSKERGHDEEIDLDGTPLPEGHQEYTVEQERFDVLWKKWDAGTITPEERAEMLKMQEDYWNVNSREVTH